MSRPLLTIAFSTLPKRIERIRFPNAKEDREILVLVQNPAESSYAFTQKSAKLIELRNVGVAKSRNAAIERASGKYLLFADDDISIDESGIEVALRYLEEHEDCSILLLRAVDENGTLRKNYFEKPTPIRLTNSARAATYEMLVRVDAIRAKDLRFDEQFGAGATNYLGDEYIFIADALRVGIKGIHLPITIAVHPKDSSGSRWGSDEDLAARSQVFKRVFRWRAPFFKAAFLLRTNNPFPGLKKAIRFIIQ